MDRDEGESKSWKQKGIQLKTETIAECLVMGQNQENRNINGTTHTHRHTHTNTFTLIH